MNKENKMREIEIEKVILSMGAVGEPLEKATRLLKIISGKNAVKTKSKKRIPDFGIRPGLEVGCKVTLRGGKAVELLKKLFNAVDNKLKKKQINNEDFSFGIKEYIEIPGVEYQRDIGMVGLNVSVVFKRKGKTISQKKIKGGKIPVSQRATKEEIINFLNKNLNIELI